MFSEEIERGPEIQTFTKNPIDYYYMDDMGSESEIKDTKQLGIIDRSKFKSVSADEVVQYDIKLIIVRGKARLSYSGPVGAVDHVIAYVSEHYEVDKRYATKNGRKIGEISVRGDGTVVDCHIDSSYTL